MARTTEREGPALRALNADVASSPLPRRSVTASYPFFACGELATGVACVWRAHWLDEKDVGFLFRARAVLYAARHHEQFSAPEFDIAVA